MINKQMLDIFNNSKKSVITDKVRIKVENGILNAGYNLKVEWDYSIIVKENRRLLVTCLEDGNQLYRSLTDLIKGKYECNACVKRKWEAIAESKNYLLIDRTDKTTVELECKVCNARSLRPITNLLGANNINCVNCQVSRYKLCASACNLTYLTSVSRQPQVDITVKCNDCSNVYVTTNSVLLQLQKNNCQFCEQSRLLKNVELKGWNYFGLVSRLKHCLHCKVCDFKRVVTTGTINCDSDIVCKQCRLNKYTTLCASKNCKFIRVDKEPKKAAVVVFLNPKGEEMTTDLGSLSSRKFATSEDNHWNLPYQVYIITTKYNKSLYYKIGIAQYANHRAKELMITGNYCVEVLGKFSNRWLAFEAEQYLHSVFKECSIPRKDVEPLASRVITRANKTEVLDGSTEWFKNLNVLIVKKEFEDKYGLDRPTENQD